MATITDSDVKITDSDGNVYYKNGSIAQTTCTTDTAVPSIGDIIKPGFMNLMISAITSLEGKVSKIDNCGYSTVCCQSQCIINKCRYKEIECNSCRQCYTAKSSDDDDG